MTWFRKVLGASVLLLCAIAATRLAAQESNSTERLFHSWVWQYQNGVLYDELQTQDPKFVGLLTRETRIWYSCVD
jgi:hypothetical protein